MRRLTKREWGLIALVPALVFVAAAAEQRDQPDAAPIAEVAHASKERKAAEPVVDVGTFDLEPLQRQVKAEDPANLFAAKSWYVPPPPPPPPPPAPPPKPTAPPLPFTYLGQYQDTGKPLIFLVRADRVITVSAGDVIEGTYRVDGIAGRTLSMTYLPLNIRQTLDIGGAG
ncbi:MAG TPA: hypothetical protein VLN59_14550 [Burkholderiales bacterium]|nr:hypothetical protein [Burkholderiales bacterium]